MKEDNTTIRAFIILILILLGVLFFTFKYDILNKVFNKEISILAIERTNRCFNEAQNNYDKCIDEPSLLDREYQHKYCQRIINEKFSDCLNGE